MDRGQSFFTRIFNLKKDSNSQKLKKETAENIYKFLDLEMPYDDFQKIFNEINNAKDNDKVKDYFDTIKEILNKDREKDKITSLNQLIQIAEEGKTSAERNIQKLEKLDPFLNFLSLECKNTNEVISDLSKSFNQLKDKKCLIKKIAKIDDENICSFINSENAINLPLNVFYRYLIKDLFANNDKKVNSIDNLLKTIENIKSESETKFTFKSLKKITVQDFYNEIVKPAQDSINENNDSNLVFKQIEANYSDFGNLSDKKFLQTVVIRILHYDDFDNLGQFFKSFFESQKDGDVEFNDIKFLIKPIKDQNLIKKFQKHSAYCKKNKRDEVFENNLSDFVEDDNANWPEIADIGIKNEQASQFFAFWKSLNLLISSFINDDSHELILVPEISNFLGDKNKYGQFQQKMQQAYIEPTIYQNYITFESIMKMLIASDIANNDDFKAVSQNGAKFFDDNQPEFYKILSGTKPLLDNEKKLIKLFTNEQANAVIEEYKYVEQIKNNNAYFEVSVINRIRLMNKDGKVVSDFPKLRLIAAKLNIVMIVTSNVTHNAEQEQSKLFVDFFQTAEMLYDKLNYLHQLNFDIADKSFTYNSLENKEKLNEDNSKLEKLIQIIDNFFNRVYKDHHINHEDIKENDDYDLCLFTKEHFFALYRLFNQFMKDTKKGKSQELSSIFAGTIISAQIEDYYDLVKKEKFGQFELSYEFNDKDFEKNLEAFSKALYNIVGKLRNKHLKNFDPYSSQLRSQGNLDDYLIGGTVRCICLYSNSGQKDVPKEDQVSSKFQLHSMILYLLYRYRTTEHNSLPLPTQLLICSMNVKKSQIDSFLEFFDSMTAKEKKYMFIVVSPIQLQPDLYDYLITKLKQINETVISKSRIVILYEYEDYDRKKALKDVIRDISVDHFKPIQDIKNLKSLYKIDEGSLYGIQAYYIYQRFPRTGKTHRILNHIYQNYKNHIYVRILVDEATTLTTLINRLNAIPRGKEVGDKKIIIHFNVDGKCHTNFHLYIQNLAFFRSLNDGVSTPFVVNDQMIFYFEFGSRPSFDNQQFIQNIFPIAIHMQEITIPEAKEFFTYTEYITKPHEKIPNALIIIEKLYSRKYLIEAATIGMLNFNIDSFLRVQKSALHVRYSDYIDYYQIYYDQQKENPKEAYENLLKMFDNLPNKDNLLISQMSDVAKIIARFKGPIKSGTVYENEKGFGYNVRRFLVGLLIEGALTNCGLPYMPPMKDNMIIDSSENDEQRLNRIKKFISREGHMLTICNPAGSEDDQSFSLIIEQDSDFIDLLIKFDYLEKDAAAFIERNKNTKDKDAKEKLKKINDIKSAIRNALNIVDPDWKKQECPDDLFKILADILNLQFYEKEKYIITMIVDTWRSLSDNAREELQKEWKDNIEIIKKNARETNHITYSSVIRDIYNDKSKTGTDFIRRKRIWYDVQDQLLNNKLFDIGSTDKQQKQNVIYVSDNIYQFISNCEQFIQNENSLMLKYTLTSQNIKRFVHLVYRIYSNVPIVLMGETGSGKTFTLQFLSEIIGKNVELIHHVIDGGTKEENLREFLRAKIQNLTVERSGKLKAKLNETSQNPKTSKVVKDAIEFIIKEKDDLISDFEDIKVRINKFVNDLTEAELKKYDVSARADNGRLKNHILFNLSKIYNLIEKDQKSYLFFFDEVNTAPCQWFIKEIILDRYFEGKILPNYIHFVCAVNPSRRLNKNLERDVLDALTLPDDDSQDDRKNLVYKVGQMPESFVPYLFPADPNRKYCSYNHDPKEAKDDSELDEKTRLKYLFDIQLNSEFDVSIDKKVESEFSIMTYPFIRNVNNNDDGNISKIGDKHHFSMTNMFSTSFDYAFFSKLFNDPQKSLKYSRSLTRLLSRINVFCCRLSCHEIYQDESFSSIRDPERCIRIMRWAYKFGLYEKLADKLDRDITIKRLRRAFIIGLSVSFWIRLSDQKPSPKVDSFRKKFIDNVCKYWGKLLNEYPEVAEVKDSFEAPTFEEWTEIIEEECKNYVNLFVDNDECVSKNKALSENVWVSFICIMNNIPLWIIGKPGTSKSLALNIVINKLMSQNSRSEKITKCPPIVSQTFMCNITTTTEAIMDQLGKIVDRSNMYNDNYIIRIQILEEIGHADMSRFKPLVCLHNIIDNGYPFRPGISIPVHLIGLSNYKMDSAKLNRGILLLRCSLDDNTMKTTASDIFKSTNLAWNQDEINYDPEKDRNIKKFTKPIQNIGSKYQEKYSNSDEATERPFIGLRDFYGLIQSLTKPLMSENLNEKQILTIIRRNFSGIPCNKELKNEKTQDLVKTTMSILFKDSDFDNDENLYKLISPKRFKNITIYYNMSQLIENNLTSEHKLLKTPIFRHILISTTNAAALLILVQNKAIELNNYKDDSPYELFFSTNMTDLPDAEWISNELRRLTTIMYQGKIAVFIGKHPCFDSLYDIFNLRYQKEGENNYVGLISYGGDSYPTIVSEKFKAIIIVESNVYESLPQPFLNRFEKFNMTFQTELSPSTITNSKKDLRSLKRKLQVQDLSTVFGCYSNDLLLSIYYIIGKTKDESLNAEDLMLLSIRPAALVHSSKNDKSFTDDLIWSSLYDNYSLHSSLYHLLHGYDLQSDSHGSIASHFYKIWKHIKGIKSIIMLPSFHNINKITGYHFIKTPSNSVNIEQSIKDEICKIGKAENPIIISILISQNKLTIDVILQYEFILESIKNWCKEDMKIKKPIHTLILISMEHDIEGLKINQSDEWPLLYLDTCYDDTIKTTEDKDLLDVSQLLFNPIKSLVDEKFIDINDLIKKARESISPCYTQNENELIDALIFNNKRNHEFYIIKPIIDLITKESEDDENRTAIEYIKENDFHNFWSFKQITLLSSPPSSIIEFLSLKLVKAIGDIVAIIFELILSGLNPKERNPKSDNFLKADIFYFMMERPEFTDMFFWILNGDSTQVYPIDSRFSYDVEKPGQFSFYKFIWQLAYNINITLGVETPNELREELFNNLFKGLKMDTTEVEESFNTLMNSELSSERNSPCFPFIAAFLLNNSNSVNVDANHTADFLNWVSCFIEILKRLFSIQKPKKAKKSKKSKNKSENKDLTVEFILYQLSNSNELISFAHDFTIAYMFFPVPPNPRKLDEFYESLVSSEIITDMENAEEGEELPADRHINTEEANLIEFISENFSKTIKTRNIDIYSANNLFRNEFTTLLARHNTLSFCGDYIEGFEYNLQQFSLIATLQQFFIQFGDKIFVGESEEARFTIPDVRFELEKEGIKIIKQFVKDNYGYLKFKEGEKVDENRITSNLLVYYLETFKQVYQGIVDAEIDDFQNDEDDGEEEEEEGE